QTWPTFNPRPPHQRPGSPTVAVPPSTNVTSRCPSSVYRETATEDVVDPVTKILPLLSGSTSSTEWETAAMPLLPNDVSKTPSGEYRAIAPDPPTMIFLSDCAAIVTILSLPPLTDVIVMPPFPNVVSIDPFEFKRI